MSDPRVVLIGGQDPRGQAGLLADADAVRRAGATAQAVVTCITAQSDNHCHLAPVAPGVVAAQMVEVATAPVKKVGMVPSNALAEVLLGHSGEWVIDPVLSTSSGVRCAPNDARSGAYGALWRMADLLTPNLPEAAELTGLPRSADPLDLASALRAEGCLRVLIKGGHSDGETVCDYFVGREGSVTVLRRPRLAGSARGTGCRLASTIAARRALGDDWEGAVCTAVAAHDRWLAARLAAAAQ
jgi:hydroxymethylpyrimidine/phosphomethylpyrimidine kinase